MGKPFAQELSTIPATFEWAIKQNIEKFKERIDNGLSRPLLAVGSGGSLSACHYAALLYQKHGTIAKAITPLELNYSKEIIKDINLLFISASGKNSDILFGFKKAIEQEPYDIINLCMKNKTPLAKLSEQYSISKTFEYNIPSGPDGFLATNSLVAFFTILLKAYSNQPLDSEFSISSSNTFIEDLNDFIDQVTPNYSFITLFGGWGQPVAIDLESKFSEAALANIFISDYRNFGHGRHHWFAKKAKNSAIIALITPEEEAIANKTLQILPKEIPRLIIKSSIEGALSSIELLVKSFYLVHNLGAIQKIDPGRPGVPLFGRKLYNLQYANLFKSENQKITNSERLAILRKAKVQSLSELNTIKINEWVKSYNKYINKLKTTKFGSLVFDYDGTLCSQDDRKREVLSEEISQALVQILQNGFVIGIVTGRGKSVRELLQNSFDSKYWKNIIIGYYNGSDIGILSDNSLPNLKLNKSKSIEKLTKHLNTYFPKNEYVVFETRPTQISIEVQNRKEWAITKKTLLQIINTIELDDIKFLESSHSIDIIFTNRFSAIAALISNEMTYVYYKT